MSISGVETRWTEQRRAATQRRRGQWSGGGRRVAQEVGFVEEMNFLGDSAGLQRGRKREMRREQRAGQLLARKLRNGKSQRPGSNRRPPAYEAGALPLSYVGVNIIVLGDAFDVVLSSSYLRDDHGCGHVLIIRPRAIIR